MFEKKPSYTPTEAKQAYEQLDQLVAKKTINPRQAGPIGGTLLAEFTSL